MAIKQFRDVIFYVLGDGASTVFSLDLSSAPVSLLPELNGGTIGITQFNFDLRSPLSIVSISISDPANPGSTATATLVRSLLTVTFSAAPDNAMNPAEVYLRIAF